MLIVVLSLCIVFIGCSNKGGPNTISGKVEIIEGGPQIVGSVRLVETNSSKQYIGKITEENTYSISGLPTGRYHFSIIFDNLNSLLYYEEIYIEGNTVKNIGESDFDGSLEITIIAPHENLKTTDFVGIMDSDFNLLIEGGFAFEDSQIKLSLPKGFQQGRYYEIFAGTATLENVYTASKRIWTDGPETQVELFLAPAITKSHSLYSNEEDDDEDKYEILTVVEGQGRIELERIDWLMPEDKPLDDDSVYIGIRRFGEMDNATFGELYLNGEPAGYTLELPWRNNVGFISCIYPGEYNAAIRKSKWIHDDAKPWREAEPGDYVNTDRRYDTIQLENRHARTGIQIHFGETLDDTEGCILPGDEIRSDEPGGETIGSSREFLILLSEKINEILKDDVPYLFKGASGRIEGFSDKLKVIIRHEDDYSKEEIKVTAIPFEKNEFIEWTDYLAGEEDNPINITIDQDTTLGAKFTEFYTLKIRITGDGEVIVKESKERYPAGELVKLTAIPGQDFSFDGWFVSYRDGDGGEPLPCVSSGADQASDYLDHGNFPNYIDTNITTTIVMDRNIIVSARFECTIDFDQIMAEVVNAFNSTMITGTNDIGKYLADEVKYDYGWGFARFYSKEDFLRYLINKHKNAEYRIVITDCSVGGRFDANKFCISGRWLEKKKKSSDGSNAIVNNYMVTLDLEKIDDSWGIWQIIVYSRH